MNKRLNTAKHQSANARNLGKDERGVAGVIFSISLAPITALSLWALNTGQSTAGHFEVSAAIDTACSRITAPALASHDNQTRAEAARDVLHRFLPRTNLDMASSSYDAEATSSGVVVGVSGNATSILTPTRLNLSKNCDGTTPFGTVFFEGFENMRVTDSGFSRWFVTTNYPNWTLDHGAGLQILEWQSGDRLGLPPDGTQYAELDSDHGRGGIAGEPLNSQISRSVYLSPGNYQLSYAYHSHSQAHGSDDDKIYAMVKNKSDGTMIVSEYHFDDDQRWNTIEISFNVTQGGQHDIIFKAGGDSSMYGGFIDSIKLERISNSLTTNSSNGSGGAIHQWGQDID